MLLVHVNKWNEVRKKVSFFRCFSLSQFFFLFRSFVGKVRSGNEITTNGHQFQQGQHCYYRTRWRGVQSSRPMVWRTAPHFVAVVDRTTNTPFTNASNAGHNMHSRQSTMHNGTPVRRLWIITAAERCNGFERIKRGLARARTHTRCGKVFASTSTTGLSCYLPDALSCQSKVCVRNIVIWPDFVCVCVVLCASSVISLVAANAHNEHKCKRQHGRRCRPSFKASVLHNFQVNMRGQIDESQTI